MENPNSKVFSRKTFEYMLYGGFIVSILMAFIAKRYQENSKSETSSRALLQTVSAGYILSCIFLLSILFFVINNTAKAVSTDTLYKQIYYAITRMIGYPLPIYITIAILIFASVQSLLYQDRLVQKHVANEYYTWNKTFMFLLSVQIITLIMFYNKKAYTSNNNTSSYQYIIYLIGLFNAIILGITQVILQFYSTDG